MVRSYRLGQNRAHRIQSKSYPLRPGLCCHCAAARYRPAAACRRQSVIPVGWHPYGQRPCANHPLYRRSQVSVPPPVPPTASRFPPPRRLCRGCGVSTVRVQGSAPPPRSKGTCPRSRPCACIHAPAAGCRWHRRSSAAPLSGPCMWIFLWASFRDFHVAKIQKYCKKTSKCDAQQLLCEAMDAVPYAFRLPRTRH